MGRRAGGCHQHPSCGQGGDSQGHTSPDCSGEPQALTPKLQGRHLPWGLQVHIALQSLPPSPHAHCPFCVERVATPLCLLLLGCGHCEGTEDTKRTFASLAQGLKLTSGLQSSDWTRDRGHCPWSCGSNGEVGNQWGTVVVLLGGHGAVGRACQAPSRRMQPSQMALGLSEECGSAACLVTPNSRSGV